jgi:hypothetical protein
MSIHMETFSLDLTFCGIIHEMPFVSGEILCTNRIDESAFCQL